jgi:large subunit ribosomal protein L15
MKLHDIYPFASESKEKKRRGRGPSSGLGCTSGKGNKGQLARAGSGPAAGFEGGQMPLVRRLPKRGFTNRFRVAYTVLNLERIISHFPEAEEITLDDLFSIASAKRPIKILARGEISRSVTITAHAFSAKAKEKIHQAGGQAVALEG